MINYYCDAKIIRNVKKEMFHPRPKVDSSIIKLTRKPSSIYNPDFTKFIASCFAMKRKTLVNNLLHHKYEKKKVIIAFNKLGIEPLSRAENLGLNQFRQLYSELSKNRQ